MNIAVIFGGESCEHDISIITGVQLLNNIDEYLYNIIPIYIDKNGCWYTGKSLKDIDNYPEFLGKLSEVSLIPNSNVLYLKKKNKLKLFNSIDFAFVCMHGQRGEDGSVAGLLELCKIPYSSSSILASSISMDKVVFKSVLKGLNILSVESIFVFKESFDLNSNIVYKEIEKLGYPVIIKPSRQGSSIGIKVCKCADEIENCLEECFMYDSRLLIEKFVHIKKEVNIALFRDKNEIVYSSTEEPKYMGEILDFNDKYKKNSGAFQSIKRIMPAEITEQEECYIKEKAKAVYEYLDMSGVVRFDFIVDNDDNIFMNEVNSIPGSMANYLFENLEYGKLVERIILTGVIRKENDEKLIKKFNGGVLGNGIDILKK